MATVTGEIKGKEFLKMRSKRKQEAEGAMGIELASGGRCLVGAPKAFAEEEGFRCQEVSKSNEQLDRRCSV